MGLMRGTVASGRITGARISIHTQAVPLTAALSSKQGLTRAISTRVLYNRPGSPEQHTALTTTSTLEETVTSIATIHPARGSEIPAKPGTPPRKFLERSCNKTKLAAAWANSDSTTTVHLAAAFLTLHLPLAEATSAEAVTVSGPCG